MGCPLCIAKILIGVFDDKITLNVRGENVTFDVANFARNWSVKDDVVSFVDTKKVKGKPLSPRLGVFNIRIGFEKFKIRFRNH